MNSKATILWNAWRSDLELAQFAEAWLTKPGNQYSEEDEQLTNWTHENPDRAAAAMFAIVQMTDNEKILGMLGAGRLEDFLGVHGEAFLDIFHSLALEQKRLRQTLDYVWQGAMPKRVWHRIEILKQSAFS